MAEPGFDLTRLRAVVFDVDGTLYRQGPLRRAMALRLVRAHLLQPRRGLRTLRAISAYRRAQEELRETSAARDLAGAQLQAAAARTGLSVEFISGCVAQWMERAPLALLPRLVQPGVADLLRALRARGVKLGVLSDYPAEDKLAALGLSGLFDVVLCAQSAEVSVFKPHPRGLQISLERLGASASEALYVGDRAEVDAAAAAAAGVACAILGAGGARDEPRCLRFASFAALGALLAPSPISPPVSPAPGSPTP